MVQLKMSTNNNRHINAQSQFKFGDFPDHLSKLFVLSLKYFVMALLMAQSQNFAEKLLGLCRQPFQLQIQFLFQQVSTFLCVCSLCINQNKTCSARIRRPPPKYLIFRMLDRCLIWTPVSFSLSLFLTQRDSCSCTKKSVSSENNSSLQPSTVRFLAQ